MAEGRLLREMVRAGARGDSSAFKRAAQDVIREERTKKHHLLANDLERILYGEDSSAPVALGRDYQVPKDHERGLDLLTNRRPIRTLAEVEVDPETRGVLDEVLLEQSHFDVLKSHGLRAIQRLLFFGPPGCGKTSAAEVLATELGVDLVIVRFDAVVSSFLGETAANLRKVFDFISANRVVALFDEFDAIAKERDDPGEHGELRRVVNAFLQMLDAYRGESVVVAATNHEHLIDSALWRRFDEVVLFDRPGLSQLEPLLEMKLRGARHELPIHDSEFLGRLVGMSHADIERVVVRAIKQMVLKGRQFLTADLFADALNRERHRIGRVAK